MYLAGYIVVGFGVAAVYAWGWLRGRRGRYERIALALSARRRCCRGAASGRRRRLGRARRRPVPAGQARGLRGARPRRRRARPMHVLGWYTRRRRALRDRDPAAALAARRRTIPNATIAGLDSVPPAERPPGQRRPHRVPDDGRDRHAARRARAAAARDLVATAPAAARRAGSTAALVLAGPLSIVALIAGWVTTEVGRQPWVVYRVMLTEDAVTGASGIPVGYTTLVLVYVGLAVAVWWVLRRLAASAAAGGRASDDARRGAARRPARRPGRLRRARRAPTSAPASGR